MAGPGADLARDVRKFVFDSFLEHSIPPVLEEIMERFRLGRPRRSRCCRPSRLRAI